MLRTLLGDVTKAGVGSLKRPVDISFGVAQDRNMRAAAGHIPIARPSTGLSKGATVEDTRLDEGCHAYDKRPGVCVATDGLRPLRDIAAAFLRSTARRAGLSKR